MDTNLAYFPARPDFHFVQSLNPPEHKIVENPAFRAGEMQWQNQSNNLRVETHGLKELADVELAVERSFEGRVLPVGSVGTIVHSYAVGNLFEVELSQPFHALITVKANEIKLARR